MTRRTEAPNRKTGRSPDGKRESPKMRIPALLLITLLVACKPSNDSPLETHKHTNDLINETSPYLLQHAHNPVDWMTGMLADAAANGIKFAISIRRSRWEKARTG